jgi:prefoldin subunit 5
MATIVPTALKVIADVQDALDKVNMVGDAMENLDRVIGKTKASFGTIGNVFESLDFGTQAIEKAIPEFEKAKEQLTELKELANMGEFVGSKEFSSAENLLKNTQEQLQKTQTATENLFNTMIRRSNSALIEMYKLPPTVENLKGALDMLVVFSASEARRKHWGRKTS